MRRENLRVGVIEPAVIQQGNFCGIEKAFTGVNAPIALLLPENAQNTYLGLGMSIASSPVSPIRHGPGTLPSMGAYSRSIQMANQANQADPSNAPRRSRGFAAMDPEKQRAISSKGGQAAHQKGTAHEFTSEEARAAGAKSHGSRNAARTGGGASTRGGSSEQHAAAGSQSHMGR